MVSLQQTPIGSSDIFHALMDRVSDAAALDRSVLVLGARGTGKAMIAARLHFLSPRWEGAFLSLNAAAYDEAALDIMLFGGTGDDGAYVHGYFSRADGGTLYIADVDHLPLRVQRKMLQLFEQGYDDPRDGSPVPEINLRLLSSTSVDLRGAVAAGRFDAEFLDYLAFDVVALPALSGRADDIAALAEHFGRKMAASLGAQRFPGFSEASLTLLSRQNWPGNVRELRSVVERSIGQAYLVDANLSEPITRLVLDPFAEVMADSPIEVLPHSQATAPAPQIDMSAPDAGPAAAPNLSFQDKVTAYERQLIDAAMNAHAHHQGKAAAALGMSYHGFRGLLRKHGLKK